MFPLTLNPLIIILNTFPRKAKQYKVQLTQFDY